MRYTVFPLHGIRVGADGPRCACSDPECKAKPGKHPAIAWKNLAAGEQIRGSAGHGLATGVRSGVFLVDTDGLDADARFVSQGPLPSTYTVRTPSGGRHFYFKWPGFPVHTGSNVLGPQIDVRGDGGMAVLPGSPHVSGREYVVETDGPVAEAPAWLLERPELRGRSVDVEGENAPTPVEEGTEVYELRKGLGVQACKEMPPSVSGQDGQGALWRLSLRLVRDLELPLDTCHSLVSEVFNPRCEPAWSDKEIRHKLVEARDKSDIKPGDAAPLVLQAPLPAVDVFLSNIQAAKGVTDESNPLGVEYGGLDGDEEQVPYLVDGILPIGSVAMFVAQPYVMKTWAAYSLAIAVSQGKPWLGKHATRQGLALIVDYEMGKRKVKRRLRMLGDDGKVGRVIKPSLRLDDPKLWEHVYDLKPALVIVDSLSAGNRVNEEKDPKFAFPLDLAGHLTNATGCSVVFIHHLVKDTGGKNKQAGVRGTGAIFGALDVCYILETLTGGVGTEKRASVECIKMREGEEPPKFSLSLTDASGVQLFDDTKEESSGAREAREGNLTTAIRLSLGKKGPASGRDLSANDRLGRRVVEVNKELAAMRDRGEVYFADRKWHLDGPNLREARIISVATDENINPRAIATPAKLAALAHVRAEDVNKLVASGRLARTSEGSTGAWFINDAE